MSDFMTYRTSIWQLVDKTTLTPIKRAALSYEDTQNQKCKVRLLHKAALPPSLTEHLSSHFLEQHFHTVQLHSLQQSKAVCTVLVQVTVDSFLP